MISRPHMRGRCAHILRSDTLAMRSDCAQEADIPNLEIRSLCVWVAPFRKRCGHFVGALFGCQAQSAGLQNVQFLRGSHSISQFNLAHELLVGLRNSHNLIS